MDEQLAEIYGTGQPEMDESDLEKTAAAELLVKLAEEQGVDLNNFSDEEVGAMLDDIYAGGGVEHTAEAEVEAEAGLQEKYAEADYLGRIMAHSMVQELDSIEKEAGIADKAKAGAGAVGKFLKGRPAAYKKSGQEAAGAFGKGWTTKERAQLIGSAAKRVAPEAGVAAGLTGGGLTMAKLRSKKKEASAFETLAQERAYELAAEAGYIEKDASDLDVEVERRALQLCEAEGIPVEWNE